MTKNETEAFKNNLMSREWRLNNLYYILNKQGKKVKFKMNWAQRELFENIHYLNVILKARQLGFSTFIEIFILDFCLFGENNKCGIIADTIDNAKKLLRDKIKFAYNNLPEALKEKISIVKNDAQEIVFSNGSSVMCSTSHRGGTLQILHISEHGKICKKEPSKAREIKTGALNTVDAGNLIFIESTAEEGDGDFFDICQIAEKKQVQEEELTELDFKFFFFPWWKEKGYELRCPKDFKVSAELHKYFCSLKTLNIKLTEEQKNWYAKKFESQGFDIKKEYPSTSKEAFESNTDDKYYFHKVQQARAQNRIIEFPIEPGIEIDTYWDLGRSDHTSIIFVQHIAKEIRIVDFLESDNEHLSFYAEELKKKKYLYGKCWLPHDARANVLQSRKNTYQQLTDLGFNCDITENLGRELGIQEVQKIFSKLVFRKSTTALLLDHIEKYAKKWNESLGKFVGPNHNKHSDAADALRYLAVCYREPLKPLPMYDDDYIEDRDENNNPYCNF